MGHFSSSFAVFLSFFRTRTCIAAPGPPRRARRAPRAAAGPDAITARRQQRSSSVESTRTPSAAEQQTSVGRAISFFLRRRGSRRRRPRPLLSLFISLRFRATPPSAAAPPPAFRPRRGPLEEGDSSIAFPRSRAPKETTEKKKRMTESFSLASLVLLPLLLPTSPRLRSCAPSGSASAPSPTTPPRGTRLRRRARSSEGSSGGARCSHRRRALRGPLLLLLLLRRRRRAPRPPLMSAPFLRPSPSSSSAPCSSARSQTRPRC